MNRQRWQQIESVFDLVAGLSGSERDAALREACGDDAALRCQVERLLERAEVSQRYFAGLAVRSGIAFTDAEDLLYEAGHRIGPYSLIRLLGRGGMGVVYLAERADAHFEKRVALKMLPLGLVTPEAIERFRRERQIVASLDHPNVARLMDGGVTGEGTPYYVMEFVTGLPLDRYCRENDLSLEARLSLFAQVCEAVGYAHQNLVIHRDLKPANILVRPDGVVKLLDFGVAKLLDSADTDGRTVTRLDQRPVTPAYAAPEVLRGEPVATACDVYSLGVILFELLTGGQPYGKTTRQDPSCLARLDAQSPPVPSRATVFGPAWARSLRGDLDNIVAKCLQCEPGRRYGGVEALRRDLERYHRRMPVSARPDTRIYRAKRFMQRHRLGVSIAVSFLVLMLAGLASTSYYAIKATREAQEAGRQRDRAQAVSEFLTGIFSASDPSHEPGREPSAGELLDQGMRTIEHDRGLDPITRASLTHLMGRLYAKLARYDEAGRLLSDAFDQISLVRPSDHPDVGAVVLDRGEWHYHSGNLQAALDDAETSLAIFRRSTDDRDPKIADALFLQGYALQELGRYEEARQSLEESLAIRRSAYGDQHPIVARSLNRLGYAQERVGRFPEAEAHYREALAISRQSLPDNDPFAAEVLNDLGRLYSYQHRYPEALEYHEQALQIRHIAYGNMHPETAMSLHNIGNALHGLGRLEEATQHLDQALDIYRQMLGPEHWLTARAESVQAEILADMGRYRESELLIDHAIETAKAAYGQSHRSVALMMLIKGYLRSKEERYTEAEAIIRRSEQIVEECCSDLDWLVNRVKARLAMSLQGQGRTDEAVSLVERFCQSVDPVSDLPVTAQMSACDFARIGVPGFGAAKRVTVAK